MRENSIQKIGPGIIGSAKPQSDEDLEAMFLSHKGYLLLSKQAIIALARLDAEEARILAATELLFGAGDSRVYGMCLWDKWERDGLQHVIQVSAFGNNSRVEMWITIVHELGYVLTRGDGHGSRWRAAAKRLGLVNPRATGAGSIEDLDPNLVAVLGRIPLPNDGRPVADDLGGFGVKKTTCKAGVGSCGGRSQGPGSGRMRLWLCECLPKPVRVRVASDDFRARCLTCGALFKRDGDATPSTTVITPRPPQGSELIRPWASEAMLAG
jgi:hypothetical protein